MRALCLLWFSPYLLFTLLSSSSKTEDQMKGGFLLDVVIRQSTTIFQLFTSKNQSLLIRWNSFLILNLSLNIVNRIIRLNIERDCFSCNTRCVITSWGWKQMKRQKRRNGGSNHQNEKKSVKWRCVGTSHMNGLRKKITRQMRKMHYDQGKCCLNNSTHRLGFLRKSAF